jgi:sulfite reductase alpha subunit-like flavoprotein
MGPSSLPTVGLINGVGRIAPFRAYLSARSAQQMDGTVKRDSALGCDSAWVKIWFS